MKHFVVSPYLMEQKIKLVVKEYFQDQEWLEIVRKEQKIERLTEEELFLVYQKYWEDRNQKWLVDYLFGGRRVENQLSVGRPIKEKPIDRFYVLNGIQIF